jgi:hypothetical protein
MVHNEQCSPAFCYDRKRQGGIPQALAPNRGINVILAMLRDHTSYQEPAPASA